MSNTAKQIEVLAAWHAEQAAKYAAAARRNRRAERKERALGLAVHHAEARDFLRALLGSLRDIAGEGKDLA